MGSMVSAVTGARKESQVWLRIHHSLGSPCPEKQGRFTRRLIPQYASGSGDITEAQPILAQDPTVQRQKTTLGL